MSHEFELRKEIALDASPDEVWDAIASGSGVDSWFMGHSEIEPFVGGAASLTVARYTETSTVTTWEPGRHLGIRVNPADGDAADTGMAIEYLIEGRAGSSTVLRLVQRGVLEGDWESEFEAMKTGWDLYLHTLAEYLRAFPGRTASPVTVMHPGADPADIVWPRLTAALGLESSPVVGADVRATLRHVGELVGTVDYVDEQPILGLRTSSALYRFMHTGAKRGNVIFLSHHLFDDVDAVATEAAWTSWLAEIATQ